MFKKIINHRKSQHIHICLKHKKEVYKGGNSLSSLALIHRSMPSLSYESLETELDLFGRRLSFPLMIGSMSGGGRLSHRMNRNLAIACQATGIGLALGSCRVLLKESPRHSSLNLRKWCPDILLLSNMGVNQLCQGVGKEELLFIQEYTQADGMYLHLNPAQELIQPEGDRDFSGQREILKDLIPGLPFPVGLKETGMGFSLDEVKSLKDCPFSLLDCAGNDGTNWALVEGFRNSQRTRGEAMDFKDWGYSTRNSLKNCLFLRDSLKVVASGGIQSGLDVFKALVLGANVASMALPFLEPALKSPQAVIEKILAVKRSFYRAMLLTGCKTLEDVQGNPSLLQV